MQTIALNVTRVEANTTQTTTDLHSDLRRARVLANWLDAKFSFAGIKFGMDAIIGLVPVVGDVLTGTAAMYPLYVAHKHGLGTTVITKMGINVAVDVLAGFVPGLGDLVDVGFRANLKNVALLEAAAEAAKNRDIVGR